MTQLLMSLVLATTLTACGLLLWEKRPQSDAADPPEVTPRGDLLPAERSTIEVFRRASPSVVHIKTASRGGFRGTITEGAGSGFIWDRRGHVVTNAHVVAGSQRALVIFADDTAQEARIIGFAPSRDLAVLKVGELPRGSVPLPLGRSNDLQVGQTILAIGNPFGLDQSLTTGVVSALGRHILSPDGRNRIWDVLQTDAAINPGNSGGPLIDSAGRVVGVSTAIYSPSGASAGIGFAIPVDSVLRVVPDLIQHGRMIRAGFGFIPDRRNRSRGKGVLVLAVEPGSVADRAGFQPLVRDAAGRLEGDLIVAVDQNPIGDHNDLNQVLDRYQAGDEVTVTLKNLRGDARRIDVRLQALSD